jgi:nucleotide-binding universal stress UspA family protein
MTARSGGRSVGTMSTPHTSHPVPDTGRHAAFRTVVCGLDGSRSSVEAARQAAAMCLPDGLLRFVAVTWESAPGAGEARLSRWRADQELGEARGVARDLGLDPELAEVSAEDPSAVLLERAAGADLLAVGVHGRAGPTRIALGRTATTVLHRAAVPVLVARRPPAGDFGESILLAVNGTPSCLRAAELAGRAALCTGGTVAIVSAPGRDTRTRHMLADAVAHLWEVTGVEPIVLDESGAAHRAVAAAAASIDASLVVTGSRGLPGAQALHSVSERIASIAPCSVLVARPPREPCG